MHETGGFIGGSNRQYLSQVLLLGGYSLTGMILATLLGYVLAIPLFGINVFSNPFAFADYENNPQVVNALRFIQLLASIGTFILPPWLVARRNAPFTVFTGLNRVPLPRFLLVAVMVLFISSPLITWLTQWNKEMQLPDFFYTLERKMKEMEDQAGDITAAFMAQKSLAVLMANLVVMALLPAIGEELFFRGALQRLLIGWTQKPWLGILLSAALFSAIHFQFYGFFPRMLIGVLLGMLFYCSGSLWTCITYHFINNGMLVLVTYYGLDKSGNEYFSEDYVYPFYTILLSLVATCALLYYVYKNRVPDGPGLEQRV